MAIPKYPKILTAADWDKNKGLLVKQYKTGVNEDLKIAEAHYKRIDWTKFEPEKALKRGSAAIDLRIAYMDAELEYKQKVQQLINVCSRVSKRAEKAKALYTTKKAPASSIAHAGKVADAAELFGKQLQLVQAELEQFKRIADNPTVESIVGADWFNKLDTVNVHANAALTNWVTSKELSISPANGKKNAELAAIQRRFGAELAAFKKAITQLKALRGKRLEAKVGKTLVIKAWREASDAYLVMKPGMQGIQREWGVAFTQLAGGKAKADAWKKKYAAADALNRRVEQLLFQAETAINELDEGIDNLSRS